MAVSGSSRSPGPDDRTAGGSFEVDDATTGRHHALPEDWHGVLTGSGRRERVHCADVVVAGGIALLVAGGAAVVGTTAGTLTAAGLGLSLVGAGSLLAPLARVDHIRTRRRDAHRDDPPHHSPTSMTGFVLLAALALLAGLRVLRIGPGP